MPIIHAIRVQTVITITIIQVENMAITCTCMFSKTDTHHRYAHCYVGSVRARVCTVVVVVKSPRSAMLTFLDYQRLGW